MLNLIIFIPTYLAFILFISIPADIIGLFLVPPMALLNKYTTKKEISIINGREILNWKYKFMYIWSNQEDGLDGAEEYRDKPLWFRIIYWAVVRNSSSNLRFVPYISVKLNPEKIKFITFGQVKNLNGDININPSLRDYDRDDLTFGILIWQGIYSNLRIQFKMNGKIYRFWIGWKLYAHDKLGISPADYRYYGAGFATQFKRIYPRGK